MERRGVDAERIAAEMSLGDCVIGGSGDYCRNCDWTHAGLDENVNFFQADEVLVL